MKNRRHIIFFFLSVCCIIGAAAHAQSITGIWRGKITQQKFGKSYHLELKLIRNGDNLTGTSYYYVAENNYYRFAVRGYIDPYSGNVIWWDHELIESKSAKTSTSPDDDGLRYAADFNCPGEGIMKLDGNAEKKNASDGKPLAVHLNKVNEPIFVDEWDFVIENFALGANDPAIIDSVDAVHNSSSPKSPQATPDKNSNPPVESRTEPPVAMVPPIQKPKPQPATDLPKDKPAETKPVIIVPQSIEDKFVNRKKILVTEIPVTGDSIELNFYDHAEIDGDSISLFLNNKILYQHILLKATPFTIKIPTGELSSENELIMVAENLGSIPPNTSLMIAYVNGQRYEARLESTENSSAMIKFVKPPKE